MDRLYKLQSCEQGDQLCMIDDNLQRWCVVDNDEDIDYEQLSFMKRLGIVFEGDSCVVFYQGFYHKD
jgi:hypothetical protein